MTPPDPTTQKLINAVELHQQGQFASADAIYREVLQADPENPDALHFFGLLHAHRGQTEIALDLISKAILIDPGNPAAFSNRGNLWISLGEHEKALKDFDAALTIQPDLVEALVNRGNAWQALGQHGKALIEYEHALAIRPGYEDAFRNQGIALQNLSRYGEALQSFENVLKARPDDMVSLANSGALLVALDQFEAAIARLDQAISAGAGTNAFVHDNRGIALFRLHRHEEALNSFERALALKPDLAETHMHRANVLAFSGHHQQAMLGLDRALSLKPDSADILWNKGLLHLLLGDFEAGWKHYESRWRTPDFQPYRRQFDAPAWTGEEPLDGKTILLYTEQGFGDVIQFCRYVPLLEAKGARVVLEAHSDLCALLRTLSPTAMIISQGTALPPIDYHSPLMSLPLAFHTTLANLPATIPYLAVDPARSRQWQDMLGARSKQRIGIVWAGTTRHRNDRNRSIALEALRPLFGASREFHCLQKEISAQDGPLLREWGIREHAHNLNDFADTAALIDQMDLVITVDTSVAHLAGALGRPVWILLPFAPDFRWLLDRADSPWYPTARLFRQPVAGDWATVVAKVASELQSQPTNA